MFHYFLSLLGIHFYTADGLESCHWPLVPCGLKSENHSVVSDSLWPHCLYSPWNFPAQNTGVGIAFPFSRGSSQPRDRTQVSCIAGGFFTSWATREAHSGVGKTQLQVLDLNSMGGSEPPSPFVGAFSWMLKGPCTALPGDWSQNPFTLLIFTDLRKTMTGRAGT